VRSSPQDLRAGAAPDGDFPPTVVARYLSDLRATLNTDVEAARALLARLIGSVILRRDGARLLAEIEGNVESLLLDDSGGDNRGAGRGILESFRQGCMK
jgi:hypothetical protein